MEYSIDHFWYYYLFSLTLYGVCSVHSDSFSPPKRIEGIIDDVRQLMDLSPSLHTHSDLLRAWKYVCVSSIKRPEQRIWYVVQYQCKRE